jgi:hypothetical protein
LNVVDVKDELPMQERCSFDEFFVLKVLILGNISLHQGSICDSASSHNLLEEIFELIEHHLPAAFYIPQDLDYHSEAICRQVLQVIL